MGTTSANSAATILIVDDSYDDRYVLGWHLQAAGYNVLEADCGREGIRLAKQLPDLILMDIALPDMDGTATIRTIKQDPELAGIPIIVLSGWDNELVKRAAVKAGCSDYLLKPIQFELLLKLIARRLNNHRSVEQSIGPPGPC